MPKYKKRTGEARPTESPILSLLDQLVLLGARQMIQQGLEAEISEYIGRKRYERHDEGTTKQYRNGYSKERQVTLSCGSIPVKTPRLRETFESEILGHYQRLSPMMHKLVPEMYLHGLSAGDFQQCFQAFLGQSAPLSETSILRMKEAWEDEYRLWKKRPLDKEYLYVWADGVYPKAGPKDDTMAVLVLVGLNRKGEKEILALEEGYRESAESWRDLLRNIKKRGVAWIGMLIADGALGLWNAQRDVFPTSKRQRCWVHKMRNVVDKVSDRDQGDVSALLHEMYVECLEDGSAMLLTYFQFPKRHWRSIKSTNVIESMFATVKLRTNAARRIPRRESALYLVFKLLTTLQARLHKIHGHRLVALTIDLLRQRKHAKLRIAA